jgi:hypothetical protein
MWSSDKHVIYNYKIIKIFIVLNINFITILKIIFNVTLNNLVNYL